MANKYENPLAYVMGCLKDKDDKLEANKALEGYLNQRIAALESALDSAIKANNEIKRILKPRITIADSKTKFVACDLTYENFSPDDFHFLVREFGLGTDIKPDGTLIEESEEETDGK